LSWDDSIPTSYTPAPSGRCPFEYFHEPYEPDFALGVIATVFDPAGHEQGQDSLWGIDYNDGDYEEARQSRAYALACLLDCAVEACRQAGVSLNPWVEPGESVSSDRQ
jgi:hypothetical protein